MVYTFKCVTCGINFITKDKRRKCCSVICANKYISKIKTGKPRSEETKQKISDSRKSKYEGKNHPRYGCKLSNITKDKISTTLKETYLHIQHPRAGKHLSDETKNKIRYALKGKYVGKNHWNWQGGISPDRAALEYKEWRTKVFKRDNYTCQITNKHNKFLVAHHIENYADNKNKRLDINNGITMTKRIHNLFHIMYGKKNTTNQQLKEFKFILGD